MALSSLATISGSRNINNSNNSNNSNRVEGNIPFVFPNSFDLYKSIPTNNGQAANKVTICNMITRDVGTDTWANGKYHIMSSNVNDGNTNPCWAGYMFNKIIPNGTNSGYWLGINSGQIHGNVSYNSSNDSVLWSVKTTGASPALYYRSGVNNGNYEGLTTNAYPTSTTYNTSILSKGDFFEVRFPFNFIIKGLYLQTETWGSPVNLRILGSMDGSNWTNIVNKNVTGTVSKTILNKIIDCSSNTIAYRHHRFVYESVDSSLSQGKAQGSMCKIEGFAQI
jgi:hypothetical protein